MMSKHIVKEESEKENWIQYHELKRPDTGINTIVHPLCLYVGLYKNNTPTLTTWCSIISKYISFPEETSVLEIQGRLIKLYYCSINLRKCQELNENRAGTKAEDQTLDNLLTHF